MYSCIYLCVLKRSGSRLHTDIMDHINQIYVNLNIGIQLEEAGHLPTSLETEFMKVFLSEVSENHIKKAVLYVRSHP